MKDEQLSEEEIQSVISTRNDFQNQINEIHKTEFESSIKLQDRQLEWQNNIATACITIAVALVALLFFSDKPKPQLIFYIGIGLIFFIAFIILFRQKIYIERDINQKSHASFSMELILLKLVHQLNKAIFLRSKNEYRKFVELSNGEVDKIFESQKKKIRIAFWNDIYVSLFLFSVGLLGSEIWPFNRISYYIFIVSLFWILLGIAIYSYIDARDDTVKTKELSERIETERQKFFEWRKQQIQKKDD